MTSYFGHASGLPARGTDRQGVDRGSERRGGRRYSPLAFTEQGVAMLSSVLRSERAVQVNIAIMRAFVKLTEMLASHRDLARRLEEMEKRYDGQSSMERMP